MEALNGAVEHIAAAVASKVETSVGEVVDRATVQLKKNVGRVFDKAQQEAEARLAKLKAEVAELEKRQGARSQDTPLLDTGIMQLSSGRVVCKVCTEKRASLVHLTMQRSVWLSVNGGANLDYNITAEFRKHKGKKNHQICACAAAAAELDPIPAALSKERARALRVMTKLLRVCCNVAIEKRSIRAYERDVRLLHLSSVDMGDTDHSRLTCRAMITLVAEFGRKQFRRFVTTRGSDIQWQRRAEEREGPHQE